MHHIGCMAGGREELYCKLEIANFKISNLHFTILSALSGG